MNYIGYLMITFGLVTAVIPSCAKADEQWDAAMASAHRMGQGSDDVTQSQIRALQSLMPNHMQRQQAEQQGGYNQPARPQTCVTVQLGYDGYGQPRYGMRCQ